MGDMTAYVSDDDFSDRFLLAIGLSLAPGIFVMLVWLLRFKIFAAAVTKQTDEPNSRATIQNTKMTEMSMESQSRTLSFIHDSFVVSAAHEVRKDASLYETETKKMIPKQNPEPKDTIKQANPLAANSPHIIDENNPEMGKSNEQRSPKHRVGSNEETDHVGQNL